jgi:hypothetical protein
MIDDMMGLKKGDLITVFFKNQFKYYGNVVGISNRFIMIFDIKDNKEIILNIDEIASIKKE